MGAGSRVVAAIVGRKIDLPPALTDIYPELAAVTYRSGGVPVRIAGWALGTALLRTLLPVGKGIRLLGLTLSNLTESADRDELEPAELMLELPL